MIRALALICVLVTVVDGLAQAPSFEETYVQRTYAALSYLSQIRVLDLTAIHDTSGLSATTSLKLKHCSISKRYRFNLDP